MFTGLIESVGEVDRLEQMPGGVRLWVRSPVAAEVGLGDSLAHNGVCLTVVAVDGQTIATEVSPETLRVTALGDLVAGDLVNLERPVRPSSPMGGHFVQGHVDATGEVVAVVEEGEFWRFTFTYPDALAALFIPKGSIAVDGISLTVASLAEGRFDVQIIPHTWTHTNLCRKRPGDPVNLECDMLGKYAVRAAELVFASREGTR
jgi:riboflavin synthase alpha subunit